MKNRWIPRLNLIIALSLSLSMIIPITGCKKRTQLLNEKPMVVIDADDAIKQLANAEENYGYENALSELTEKSTNTIDGDNYYRLQQNYKGIPVYGRTVVCSTDEDGNVTSFTGNVQDITTEINLTPTITTEQARQSIQTYSTEILKLQNSESITIELREEDLYVYTDTEHPTLVYSFLVGANRVILDAHDASVLSCQSVVMPNEILYTGPEGTKSVQGINPIGGRYILKDAARNIYVYDAQGQTYWYPGTGHNDDDILLGVPTLVSSVDTEFGNNDDNTSSSDIAYTFLNELGAVYDFFAKMGETGTGTFVGICNDMMNNPNRPREGYHGKNAGGYCGPLNNMLEKELPDIDKPLNEINAAVIIMGSAYNQSIRSLTDLFGHEYQHTVFQKYAGDSNHHDESGAINEGIADIMGELYESSYKEINWEHGDRIIHNPSQNGYPKSFNEINPELMKNLNTDFAHACSTIISHSAYLMWNGINGNNSQRLSTQELSELWYRAVLMMPSDCDFSLCRKLVEIAAQSMEKLNTEQQTCIRKAFDYVGISSSHEDIFNPDYQLNKEATLTVYDQNLELYSGYTLQINGTIDMSEIASNMTPDIGWIVNRTHTVKNPGAYKLDLPKGHYILTITDHYSDESYTIYVEISNDSTETKIDLITTFESPLVVVLSGPEYEELVTDAYSDAIVDGNEVYCYHIPQINLNDNHGEDFNFNLYDKFYNLLLTDVYQSINEYDYPSLSKMVYTWGKKDNLVSIVVQTDHTNYALTDFFVYTISVDTGEEISHIELLNAYDLSEANFYNLVKETLIEYWDSRKSDMISFVGEDYYNTLVEQTVAEENVKNAIPYINSNGELCFVAYIYSAAGADKYLHLLNTTGTADEGWLECTLNHLIEKTETDTSDYLDISETEQVKSTLEIHSDTITEQELLGEWVVDTEYTMEFNDMSMWDFYGTSFSSSGNQMTFGSDGSYEYYVAWCYGNGTFELQNNEIVVNLTDGDPIQGTIKLLVMTDGVTRIALDQHGDGNLIFWIKS